MVVPPRPTNVMTFSLVLFFACQLVPLENEDLFLGEDFFFFFWGGGGLSAQNVSAPYQNPRPPSGPPWKNPSYATA